jgi:hypothetical protein
MQLIIQCGVRKTTVHSINGTDFGFKEWTRGGGSAYERSSMRRKKFAQLSRAGISANYRLLSEGMVEMLKPFDYTRKSPCINRSLQGLPRAILTFEQQAVIRKLMRSCNWIY